MAKKWKRKIEEDKSEFKYPKFDENEYIVKELKETRILFVTIFSAIIFACISLAVMIYVSKDFLIGFIVGIIGIISIRYIYPAFKIDISAFDGKKWVMSGLSFFGIWLAVWVIICNPPISDFTPPVINNVHTSISTGTINNDGYVSTYLNGSSNITIDAKITDNYQLNTGSVYFNIDASGKSLPKATLVKTNSNTYTWKVTGITLDTYTISISAKDRSNNQKTFTFTLDIKG